MKRKAKVLPAMEPDKHTPTPPATRSPGSMSPLYTDRATGRTFPQRSVRRSEAPTCPFHAVRHILHSRRQQAKPLRGDGGPAGAQPPPRPIGQRRGRGGGPRRAAAASPAAPRARSQGRGGRHHLVNRPPPAAPASPGTKGGQRRFPRRRAGRGRQRKPPTPGNRAGHPQPGHPPPDPAGRCPPPLRLTSRRREAPQPRRNSRMLLRHSPSVRGSGYTCKRRGGRLSAGTGTPRHGTARRSPPRRSPHLPLPPQAAAAAAPIAPCEGVEPGSKHGAQEMACEGRGRRAGARAGVPRPGAAPGGSAPPRGGRGGEGRGGEGGAARPGPALPRPAPAAAAGSAGGGKAWSPAGSTPRPRRLVFFNFFK